MPQKTSPHRVKLADFKARKLDEGAIDVEADDGTVHRIPPPELWPDEAHAMLRNEELVGAAQAIMGADQFAAFAGAGGSAALVFAVIKDVHGLGPGE